MKNKKNLKILIPVVVFIWGMVIYNIVDAFSSNEMVMAKNVRSSFKIPITKEKETFAMLPIPSDPFLGTMYSKPKPKKSRGRKVRQEITWPSISYQGIISGKTKKLAVFIVSINGQQYLLKKGDTLQSLKVLKGNTESLRLKFKGQTKEFPIM